MEHAGIAQKRPRTRPLGPGRGPVPGKALKFERTHDPNLIRRVMTDPAVWRHVSDDGTPAPELWRPVESDSVWYVSVHEGEQLLGMFVLAAHNFICWEIHTCLLPVAWGPLARRVALAMAAWIWENTPCRRLITNVPTCNRIALRFAKDAGMLQYGFNEKSILKGGRKCDQICLGLTKED